MVFAPMMIGPVVVDAFITETHTMTSETTDYAREQGPNVADHTRALPREFSCEGIISDAPLGIDMVELRARETGGTIAPSEFAYAQLEKIRDDREPVTVVTSLRTYESMVMLSLEVTRDKDNGKALAFTAQFKQITIVVNQRTVIRTEIAGAKGVNRGFKAGKPVAVQTITTANGSKETATVYVTKGPGGLKQYTYADGSPYKNRGGQELTSNQKALAKNVTLDKNRYADTRPGQTRQPGVPFKPMWSGGKN